MFINLKSPEFIDTCFIRTYLPAISLADPQGCPPLFHKNFLQFHAIVHKNDQNNRFTRLPALRSVPCFRKNPELDLEVFFH